MARGAGGREGPRHGEQRDGATGEEIVRSDLLRAVLGHLDDSGAGDAFALRNGHGLPPGLVGVGGTLGLAGGLSRGRHGIWRAAPPKRRPAIGKGDKGRIFARSEEHTSELQSLMSSSYAVFCLQKKKKHR